MDWGLGGDEIFGRGGSLKDFIDTSWKNDYDITITKNRPNVLTSKPYQEPQKMEGNDNIALGEEKMKDEEKAVIVEDILLERKVNLMWNGQLYERNSYQLKIIENALLGSSSVTSTPSVDTDNTAQAVCPRSEYSSATNYSTLTLRGHRFGSKGISLLTESLKQG